MGDGGGHEALINGSQPKTWPNEFCLSNLGLGGSSASRLACDVVRGSTRTGQKPRQNGGPKDSRATRLS